MRPFPKICPAIGWMTLAALSLQAEGVPEGYTVQRYESLWKKSPFTLSSVSVEEAHGFAQNFAMAGIAKIGSRDLVILIDKKSKERTFLTQQPNEQGIRLVSVESNNNVLKVSVTIKKGDEVAVVKFDPGLLAEHPANQPANAANPPQATLQAQTLAQPPAAHQPTILPAFPTQQPPPPVTGVIKRRVVPMPVPGQ